MVAELERFREEIEKIEGAEELRRILLSLKQENIDLKNRESELLNTYEEMAVTYRQMQDELKGIREENRELKKKLEKEEAKNTLQANRIFGRQTEKTSDLVQDQDLEKEDPLSEDTDPEDPVAGGSQKDTPTDTDGRGQKSTGRTGGRRPKGKHHRDLGRLPQRDVYEYDTQELDRLYGAGNWRFYKWHETLKVEHVPALYYVKRIHTPVVSVGLDHSLFCMPPSGILLPGSDATPSLVSSIMTNKFSLSLPAYRQEWQLALRGVSISRQTMSNWIIRFSKENFKKVYGWMAKLLKDTGCTQSDETTLLVIRDGRRAGRKSFIWVHITSELSCGHPIAVFSYEPDRSTDHLRDFYKGYVGQIICDAYSAYQTFAKENGTNVIICGCWMHARRRWVNALRIKDVAGLSNEEIDALPEVKALRLIGEIYDAEMALKELTAEERLARRSSEVKDKVNAYYELVESIDLEDPAVSEKMKDACKYSLNQKEQLCRFLENGNIPIDNGACEHRIRDLAIGRANWEFCTSTKGAEACAIMYTMVETAKINGSDPYFYLKYLLEKAPVTSMLEPGPKYMESLMPWSEEYKKYEQEQKQMLIDLYLPPSEEDPTKKKMKQPA